MFELKIPNSYAATLSGVLEIKTGFVATTGAISARLLVGVGEQVVTERFQLGLQGRVALAQPLEQEAAHVLLLPFRTWWSPCTITKPPDRTRSRSHRSHRAQDHLETSARKAAGEPAERHAVGYSPLAQDGVGVFVHKPEV